MSWIQQKTIACPHASVFTIRTLECFSSLLGCDCQPMQWTYWVIRLILYPPNSPSIGFHGKYVQTHRTKSTWESVEGGEEKREWTLYFYLQIKAKYIYIKYDPLKLASISYLNSSSFQLISCCNERFKTKFYPSCIWPLSLGKKLHCLLSVLQLILKTWQ